MSKIKELPVLERPREKAVRYGVGSLSNEELIAVLIRTGTKDESALDLAHTINSRFHGLSNLFNASYHALTDINGIGPGKAMILSACFELCNRFLSSMHGESGRVTTTDIYNRYALKMNKSNKEIFTLVILNRKKEIIHEESLYLGSELHIDCQPIEIVKKVIKHNGRYFYMIHNHPSGDSKASKEDIALTESIIAISHRLGVLMLDHIIVGDDGYYSYQETSGYNPSNY